MALGQAARPRQAPPGEDLSRYGGAPAAGG
jgi:hypothetical protein